MERVSTSCDRGMSVSSGMLRLDVQTCCHCCDGATAITEQQMCHMQLLRGRVGQYRDGQVSWSAPADKGHARCGAISGAP